MKCLKFLGLLLASTLVSLSSFADDITIRLNGGQYNLPSCGGTVEFNNGGNDNQLNVVFRKVQDCSFITMQDSRQYQMSQPQGQRSGSYTVVDVSKAYYASGDYQSTVLVQSKSGGHWDRITVKFKITSGYDNF